MATAVLASNNQDLTRENSKKKNSAENAASSESIFGLYFKRLMSMLNRCRTIYYENPGEQNPSINPGRALVSENSKKGKKSVYKTLEFFQEPVSKEENPEFYVLVKDPISFKEINEKFHANLYRSLYDVWQDIEKLCDGAQEYFKEGTFASIDAQCIRRETRKFMAERFTKHFPQQHSKISLAKIKRVRAQKNSLKSQIQDENETSRDAKQVTKKPSNRNVLKPLTNHNLQEKAIAAKTIAQTSRRPTKISLSLKQEQIPPAELPTKIDQKRKRQVSPEAEENALMVIESNEHVDDKKVHSDIATNTTVISEEPKTTTPPTKILKVERRSSSAMNLTCIFCRGLEPSDNSIGIPLSDTLLMPCAHMIMCNHCAAICQFCPRCGEKVERTLKAKF